MTAQQQAYDPYWDIRSDTPYIKDDYSSCGDVAYIEMIFVPDESRGQGIAPLMFKEWLAKLDPNVKRVKLKPATLGGCDAEVFWKKLGFTTAYVGDDSDDAIDGALTIGVNGYSTPVPELVDSSKDECRHWIEGPEDRIHFSKNPQVKVKSS